MLDHGPDFSFKNENKPHPQEAQRNKIYLSRRSKGPFLTLRQASATVFHLFLMRKGFSKKRELVFYLIFQAVPSAPAAEADFKAYKLNFLYL
jgi:hypothetical protein